MKQTVNEAALDHQKGFPTYDDETVTGAFSNGMHEQSYKSFIAGAEWKANQSPWKKAKDELPFVDEDDISEQSEPVLVIISIKGHYEPEILVYNKHYHVWDTADADDYYCDVSDNDLWTYIPKV